MSLEGQIGMLLIAPFGSATTACTIPLGTSIDLKLRASGVVPIMGSGSFFFAGVGIGVR